MNLNEIMANTIFNTQYITKGRLKKFLKQYGYCDDDKADVYKEILNIIEVGSENVIEQLQEYEFEKNYKYFSLYKVNCNGIDDKLESIKNILNSDKIDFISRQIENPSIKKYSNEIDIKFSLLLHDVSSNKTIKYPIVTTIFKDIGLVCIKFCSVSEDYYEDEFYININNKVKCWISDKLDLKLDEFDSMNVFKSLYYKIRSNPDAYPNESIHSILMDDEMNGRSYFRASDKDMLPFLDDLLKLVKEFENENDKKKVLLYIDRYESEAIVRSMGITWKNRFSNSRGKRGNITVSIGKTYSVNNLDSKVTYEFLLHHIHQNSGINRERINYVIRYISNYLNEDIK